MQISWLTEAETKGYLLEMVWNSDSTRSSHLILSFDETILFETWTHFGVKVVAGTVSAKTDRLEGIVDFTEQQVGLECFFWIDFDPLALSDKGTF